MKKLTNKEIEGLLRDNHLRVTEHRFAVLKTVASAKSALTVQTIFDMLREDYMIDQATVYRNLSSLHEAGLLKRTDFNHGHAHYELETGEPSHQLICSKCETIEKIEGISIDDIVKKMLRKSSKFKKMTSHSIEVYGLCKKCVLTL
jgi:Fur family ferric uptake transcriptional regulator